MSVAQDLEARRVRAAKNQSLFREVNERIEQLAAGKPGSTFKEMRLAMQIDLACECMDESCAKEVTMTVEQYEAIRAESNSFFVIPGHEVSDVEEIGHRGAKYVVVRKLGSGAAVAEKFDPRKRMR